MAERNTPWVDPIFDGDTDNKFELTDNGDGSVQLVHTPTILNEPTPFNSLRMNSIEQAITENSQNIVTNEQSITDINSKIPVQATQDNQLADKAFVNSTAAYLAAYALYKTENQESFATAAELRASTIFYRADGTEAPPSVNDYTIVVADEEREGSYFNTTTRWKYFQNIGWGYDMPLGRSLTADQEDSLNSGSTKSVIDHARSLLENGVTYNDLAQSLRLVIDSLTDYRNYPDPIITFYGKRQLEILGTVFNVEDILDQGTITNGKDYYIFESGDTVKTYQISLSKQEDGKTLIGGFHTECADIGTGLTYVIGGVTEQHPLNGFITGDIIPNSVWCLNHRPISEPEGMVYIPSLDFWCDIYLQSDFGKNTKSVYQGAITRNRQYVDLVEDQFCVNKELLDDAEFAVAMLGSNEQTAVAGASEAGATTGGAGGRKDIAGRRMISIYGVEEGCGSLWQFLRTTSAAGVAGSMYGQTNAAGTQGWLTLTTSSYGPNSQSGGKGSFWGLAGALLAGGDWSSSTGCGSRSRHAYSSRSRSVSGIGVRGRSRTKR